MLFPKNVEAEEKEFAEIKCDYLTEDHKFTFTFTSDGTGTGGELNFSNKVINVDKEDYCGGKWNYIFDQETINANFKFNDFYNIYSHKISCFEKLYVRYQYNHLECTASVAIFAEDPQNGDFKEYKLNEQVYNGKPFKDDNSLDNNNKVDCQSLIGTVSDDGSDNGSLAWILNKLLKYIKIIGPIIVLLLSSYEFLMAIISNNDDNMKKAQNRLIKRIILAVALFLIPSIVSLLLNIFGFNGDGICIVSGK